jgi:4-hydroxy-tetrahydrodipicolinate reductase
MANKPKVIIAGAYGRMGKAAVEAFLNNSDKFELIAGIVRDPKNIDETYRNYLSANKVILSNNIEKELHTGADILVELTTPDSVFENSKLALKNGVRPVIGATGLSDDDINELSSLAAKNSLGAIIAPNFAIGAILMMKFAAEAARHMDRFEIIETHHDKKLDSPSGTAIKTAKLMAKNAKKPNQSPHAGEAARGELVDGVPIHSLRLQGTIANQEVVFGGLGQTLSISHVTIDRSSFMPGILLASEKVMNLDKLIYGLENII